MDLFLLEYYFESNLLHLMAEHFPVMIGGGGFHTLGKVYNFQQVGTLYIYIFVKRRLGMQIHSVPHNSNSLVSNYRLFRRPPSTTKITPLTQC